MEVRCEEDTTPWQRPRGKRGDTGDDDREDRRGQIEVGMDMTVGQFHKLALLSNVCWH